MGEAPKSIQQMLNLNPAAGEVFLFHATSPDVALLICQNGFLRSETGKSGPGGYLADLAAKADEYARPLQDGHQLPFRGLDPEVLEEHLPGEPPNAKVVFEFDRGRVRKLAEDKKIRYPQDMDFLTGVIKATNEKSTRDKPLIRVRKCEVGTRCQQIFKDVDIN